MVLDTSALVAILFDEPDAERFEAAIEQDAVRLISAASFLETAIVVEARLGDAGGRELDLFSHKAALEVVAVDVEQVELARHAYRSFGKGRHRASLNFGDCFSYALSKNSNEPLLCKGDDFVHTDLVLVSLRDFPANHGPLPAV